MVVLPCCLTEIWCCDVVYLMILQVPKMEIGDQGGLLDPQSVLCEIKEIHRIKVCVNLCMNAQFNCEVVVLAYTP